MAVALRQRFVGDQRRGKGPAGLEVREGRAQRRGAARLAAEQVHELHRRKDRREGAAEIELAGVRAHRLDLDTGFGAPGGERVQELLREVERRHVDAPAGEGERHASGPRPQLEHRPARLGGELGPDRQVGGVGAALDVVPDHLRVQSGRAHCQNSGASPRALSSRRSSISAV